MYSVVGLLASPIGVAPFRDSRIKGCLPPPRDLSQAATSFVGSFIPSHPPYALTCFDRPESRAITTGRQLVSFASIPHGIVRNTIVALYVLHSIAKLFSSADPHDTGTIGFKGLSSIVEDQSAAPCAFGTVQVRRTLMAVEDGFRRSSVSDSGISEKENRLAGGQATIPLREGPVA
jgi:hypothetical protein